MNIRFLRIFTFLMCAFTTGIVNARTLHVGNKSFALSQTKYTTPSLAFGFGNEVWYAPLTTEVITNTLHIKHDNKTYSLCQPFADTENYTYDEDGRLIDADSNLWIEFVAQSGINTEFTPNQDTRVYAVVKVIENNKWLFGTREGQTTNAFGTFCPSPTSSNINISDDFANTRKFLSSGLCLPYGKFTVDKNKNVTKLTTGQGSVYTQSHTYTKFTAKQPMGIGFVKSVTVNSSGGGSGTARFYSVKIWDNGTLVRHFVPVPACMWIGDFITPTAGMFDTVEQKFYSPTVAHPNFINLRQGHTYGKDE